MSSSVSYHPTEIRSALLGGEAFAAKGDRLGAETAAHSVDKPLPNLFPILKQNRRVCSESLVFANRKAMNRCLHPLAPSLREGEPIRLLSPLP
ncbi:MAG: hypothetical protein F6K28_28235 [Microcoleus sp. SIO2G3]|nr:hypothetical protein [Microcoleus sp. SIO2G3]